MASVPDNRIPLARNALAIAYLERLADSVARIEFSYPAANLGLAAACRDALESVESMLCDEEHGDASTDKDDGLHAIEMLEAQQKLGLVPQHEYRRERRKLSRSLGQSRFAGVPVLQRVVGAGTVLLDGLDEGLCLLGDIAERLYRQRISVRM